jgi:hypothetical protein
MWQEPARDTLPTVSHHQANVYKNATHIPASDIGEAFRPVVPPWFGE